MGIEKSWLWLPRILIACSILLPQSAAAAAGERQPLASSSADVIAAVNSLRAAHGLPAYAQNSILMGTAQAQADYMASTGTVTHIGPGGTRPYQRGLNAGYPLAGQIPPGFFSENIQAGPGLGASDAVQAWTGDQLHLNTMLSADLQQIGAGVAQAGGMVYYVIDCARPTGSGLPPAYTPGAAEDQFSGSEIIVPVTLSTPDANGDIVHVVQQGQSLWQIAIAYGVKIDAIRALNQLPQTYQIQPGDKLLIVHVGTATPSSIPPTEAPSPEPPTAIPTVSNPTSTPPVATPTPVVPAPWSGVGSSGAAVGAIIITALIAAGLVAWAGRNRPV